MHPVVQPVVGCTVTVVQPVGQLFNGSPMSAAQGTTVHETTPRTLLVGSTCGPLAAVSCLCRDTVVRCSVVGLFLWPARRPGTRYQTIFVIRRVVWAVSVATWKLFSSRSTGVHSALEALRLFVQWRLYNRLDNRLHRINGV